MASGSDKRKAEESPDKVIPYPRLRRRASLPDLQDASDPKKSYSLPDLMKKGFLDPDIMRDVIPSILDKLQPSIELTIQKTLERTLSKSIEKAIEHEMSKYKVEVIQPLLDKKDAEINALKADVRDRDHKVKLLENEVTKLTTGLNDLEQYGRRYNLRLNNVHLEEDSNCEEVVLNILNRALPKEASPILSQDIDRCHPIGRLNKNNNRQVIIKFISYKVRAKAYDARFNLSNVYMTEDFTPINQKVVNQLVQLKKGKRIKKFWSVDGKVFAKTTDLQPKCRIRSSDDITNMIKHAVEEGYIEDMGEVESLEIQ